MISIKLITIWGIIFFHLASYCHAYGGTYSQVEACSGKTNVVLKNDADAGADPDGWFVYSGGLTFCCAGQPLDVMCAEMMVGFCDCPVYETVENLTIGASPVCYARKCTEQVQAHPITHGVIGVEGEAAMCLLPGSMNYTVMAEDFCAAYAPQRFPKVSPPKTKHPEKTGTFELLINQDTNTSSTGVVPVHAVMIPNTDRMLFWTRGQLPNVPAQPGTDFAVSVVYDWNTGKYEPVYVDSNPFCSGVGFSKNGNILAFGGEQESAPWGKQWQPTQTIEGRNKIREFDVTSNTWATLDEVLPGNHWYPTQVLLEDGRVLNQGGFKAMVGPQNEQFEIFDSTTNKLVKYYNTTEFAQDNSIMNLYPFFSYLPYTNPQKPDDIYLLMDLCNNAQMYTISKENDLERKTVLPEMGDGVTEYCAAFSAVGFSRFLPFKPPYNKPEYIAFGGIQNSTQDILDGKCWADIMGSDKSFRIGVNPVELINGASKWEEETMPFKRVGGLSVTLPNGKLVLMNGAEYGSGNDYLRSPTKTAVMYDPDAPAGERYSVLATSPIKRLYHNVAMLLPNGNVFVAGGEQGEAYSGEYGDTERPWCGTTYDYTFEAEIFKPPYVYQPQERPVIARVTQTGSGGHETQHHPFGSTIRVYYDGPDVNGATITSPSAVTHGLDMHSRTAFLEVSTSGRVQTSKQGSAGAKYVDLVLPTMAHRVTTSGWHMLFLLNGDFPSTEAKWVFIEDTKNEDSGLHKKKRNLRHV